MYFTIFFFLVENMSSTTRSASQSYSIPSITSNMVLPRPVGAVPNPSLDPNQQLVIIYFRWEKKNPIWGPNTLSAIVWFCKKLIEVLTINTQIFLSRIFSNHQDHKVTSHQSYLVSSHFLIRCFNFLWFLLLLLRIQFNWMLFMPRNCSWKFLSQYLFLMLRIFKDSCHDRRSSCSAESVAAGSGCSWFGCGRIAGPKKSWPYSSSWGDNREACIWKSSSKNEE